MDIKLREIKKEQIEILEKRKIIRNTGNGFIDKFGNKIGFYRTQNKRYIEDKYVNIATKLS